MFEKKAKNGGEEGRAEEDIIGGQMVHKWR